MSIFHRVIRTKTHQRLCGNREDREPILIKKKKCFLYFYREKYEEGRTSYVPIENEEKKIVYP